jgi:hypothetical protein
MFDHENSNSYQSDLNIYVAVICIEINKHYGFSPAG